MSETGLLSTNPEKRGKKLYIYLKSIICDRVIISVALTQTDDFSNMDSYSASELYALGADSLELLLQRWKIYIPGDMLGYTLTLHRGMKIN